MNCAALISEVCCRKPLWDSTHPQHHNRTVLDKLWDEVAQNMDFSGMYHSRETSMKNVYIL